MSYKLGVNINNLRARFRGSLPTIPLWDFKTRRDIRVAKRRLGIQLTVPQLQSLVNILQQKPCNFLVFGLGNDTPFWLRVNKEGMTVFLEDNKEWLDKISGKCPDLNAHLIEYNTNINDWKILLGNDNQLFIQLPSQLQSIQWDVILVDAPGGWDSDSTGRMKSIFMASELAKNGTHIFVHDCDRNVEKAYCDRYLSKYKLVETIGILRHYVFNP